MAYLVLFDSAFHPLGSPSSGDVSSVHVCKSWSLKRKAYEFDEFTAVCKGYKDSRNAVYAGLFENDGTLIYRCLSGIPTTKDGLTTVNGIDVRQIFNQEIPVDYTKAVDKGGTTSEYTIYSLLVRESLKDLAKGVALSGVKFKTDFLDLTEDRIDNVSSSVIATTKEIRNVWDQIQACNASFSKVLLAEWANDRKNNSYSLTFKVSPVFNVYTVRLSDFDAKRTLNQNIVNHVSVWNSNLSGKIEEYFLLKRPEVEEKENDGLTTYKFTYITTEFSDKVCFPIRSKAFARKEVKVASSSDNPTEEEASTYGKNLSEAREEAVQALLGSISKDRVTIDLNSKYGKRLKGITLSDRGLLAGYYSADGEGETDKYLPVSAIYTDSNGTNKVEFGRLSEYWFLE